MLPVEVVVLAQRLRKSTKCSCFPPPYPLFIFSSYMFDLFIVCLYCICFKLDLRQFFWYLFTSVRSLLSIVV